MQGFEDLFCRFFSRVLNIYNTNFTSLSTVQRRPFGFVTINEALNFDFELRLFFSLFIWGNWGLLFIESFLKFWVMSGSEVVQIEERKKILSHEFTGVHLFLWLLEQIWILLLKPKPTIFIHIFSFEWIVALFFLGSYSNFESVLFVVKNKKINKHRISVFQYCFISCNHFLRFDFPFAVKFFLLVKNKLLPRLFSIDT